MNLELPKDRITQFCQKWQIQELSLFGSVLRDDFQADSDIDILVTFLEDTHWTLFDLGRMESELNQIFDRKVDLVSKRGIKSSRNHIRRDAILNSAEVIYAA